MGLRFIRTFLFAALFVALCLPLSARAQAARACSTFDEANEASSTFAPGEQIIVRGTGFGTGAPVTVRFEQGEFTKDLGRVSANDLGAFAAPPALLPEDATEGGATIVALDARGSANCTIAMSAVATEDESGPSVLEMIWGGVLVVGAIILAVLTFRRWKNERLRKALEQFRPSTENAGAQGGSPYWELDPYEEAARLAKGQVPQAVAPPGTDTSDEEYVPLDAEVLDTPQHSDLYEAPRYVTFDEERLPKLNQPAPRRTPRRPVAPQKPVAPEPVAPEPAVVEADAEPEAQVTFPIGPQPDDEAFVDDFADIADDDIEDEPDDDIEDEPDDDPDDDMEDEPDDDPDDDMEDDADDVIVDDFADIADDDPSEDEPADDEPEVVDEAPPPPPPKPKAKPRAKPKAKPRPKRRPEPAPEPQPVLTEERDTTAEPPRLPEGWDAGRLRPSRQPSDAIERLQREVRTWDRS